jgi:hypothetical protein
MTEHPLNDRYEMADAAADLVEETLLELMERAHMPPHVFLAGAHAAIVTLIVDEVGGPMAAESCTRAAERVRDLPSRHAVLLAAVPPAGSA